jgi:hypothetical protein
MRTRLVVNLGGEGKGNGFHAKFAKERAKFRKEAAGFGERSWLVRLLHL